ncbi:DUF4435 domain-containing protein [Tritonibacter mobilis]|uniref:DUF4435 domain-containing protein n=1 Tax=Tritonibacter mobilis TaxID=379347 RepID=UPI001445D628|nr:DUF4435 domain-containing protein [Rhodobacteraceae bacterium R_SAG5]
MRREDFANDPTTEAMIMLGSNAKKRIIFLEGDADFTFWSFHLKFEDFNASALVVEGKESVRQCVQDASNDFSERVLGLVDRDFDPEIRYNSNGFLGVITSTHNDLELDVLEHTDFSRSLVTSLSQTKVDKSGVSAKDLIDLSITVGATLGALRKVNKDKALGLDFHCYKIKSRDISLEKIPKGDWFDANSIYRKYISDKKNSDKISNADELIEFCEEEIRLACGEMHLCRGHDVTLVISIMHNIFRKSGRSSRNGDDINDLLLGHITTIEASAMPIFSDLVTWLE